MKKTLIILAIILTAGAGYWAWLKLSPNKFTDVYYLVPDDAVMVVETEDPVNNWQTFSTSNMWLGLKSFPAFAEITKNADLLDELIKQNQQVFSLLGQRHLLISTHMTKAKDFDFVYYADMQEASKSSAFKASLISIINQFDYKQTVREIEGVEIYEFLDPKTRDVLSISFLKNYLICSYNKALIEKVIKTSNNPDVQLGNKPQFTEVNRLTSTNGLCRILINYSTFHQYLGVYMDDASSIKELFGSMFYTGLDCSLNDDLMLADGYSIVNDSLSSYLQALAISGKSETNSESVLSERTSFNLTLGFADFNTFYSNLDKVLQKDEKTHKTKQDAIKKVKKLLGIDLQKDLFDWMGSEIAVAQYQTDVLIGYKVHSIIAIKTKSKSEATDGLNRIEKQIRKRTPLKFKEISYKNYPIKYLEIKGLFKSILGNLFGKIEKPYYTIINDYVVMSDDPKTLLLTIDDFIEQKTLSNKESYRNFRGKFANQVSVLSYLSPDYHFGNFKGLLNKESWESSKKNQNHIRSFSQIGLCLSGESDRMRTIFASEYKKWELPKTIETSEIDTLTTDFSDTLSALDLFIITNFQNNMNNTYYENGNIKTSSEMEGNIQDGAFIEYYENGVIKTKGQYKKGLKDGTWKFYKPNGELESKTKLKEGVETKGGFWNKLFGFYSIRAINIS